MIVFGSRRSALARAQTEMVARAVAAHSGEEYRVEIIDTRGDRQLDVPLPEIGGKGVFTLELEEALRAGRIDAAVHSLKDLPVEDPDGIMLGAIPERVSPLDVLIYDPAHRVEGEGLPIADGTVVAAKTAVFQSIKEPGFVAGVPATDHRAWKRQSAATRKLPELLQRVRELEQRLAELERKA